MNHRIKQFISRIVSVAARGIFSTGLIGIGFCAGLSPLHAAEFTLRSNLPSDDSASIKKAQWIATLRDSSSSTDAKTDALDSLAVLFDPQLLELFKDMAFRSADKTVSMRAITDITSFIMTYRWSEVYDTLIDIMLYHADPDIRDTTLQVNKIALDALTAGIPFDRNNLVDALVAMISPQTHTSRARTFYSAVWFLAKVATDEDTAAVAMMRYVRSNYAAYELTDAITGADAYQYFKQRIDTVYFQWIHENTLPPLIDTIPAAATTGYYISAVNHMLDSAATDELGFTALSWLKANGQPDNGDEGKRIAYLYSVTARKRPDRAIEIMTAINELFPRFGLGVEKPRSSFYTITRRESFYDMRSRRLFVDNLRPGDRVAVFELSGRLLSATTVSERNFSWIDYYGFGVRRLIVSVNNLALTAGMRR